MGFWWGVEMSFADDLKAALTTERDTADVPFTLNGNEYVLRFTQMDPWEWAEEADRHPARSNVQLDRSFGYNLRTLVRAVAPRCGVLLVDGEPVAVEDWDNLFKAMSPSAVQRMCSAVFGLHEADAIDAVVKSAKKLRSTVGASSKAQ